MSDNEYIEKECSQDIIKGIARDMNLQKGTVEDVVKSMSSFIADTIRRGEFEGVTVPYFGKFQTKFRSVQYSNFLFAVGKTVKNMIRGNSKAIMEILKIDDQEAEDIEQDED